MTMTIYSINEVLQQHNSALREILNKVHILNELNSFVKPLLDPKIAQYCEVANFFPDKIVLVTKNSSIATTIRFTAPDLLPKLKQHPLLKNILKITCKVHL